jgi:hypothetical protein
MSKKISIIQSNYIPWKGYFDLIGLADEFIVYDDAQFTKNDWRNRNKIKTKNGVEWITIPVYHRSLSQKISETQVSSSKWGVKNWNAIKTNYGKAPHFKLYGPQFEQFYLTQTSTFLSDINISLIKTICEILKIKTKISNVADYDLAGDANEKLIGLCKQSKASHYLSGPAAKDYLKEDRFSNEGITVEWMDYSGYPEYPQLHPPFTHHVSILDLIFNTGHDSFKYMKYSKYED